jgi:hypothetical protein
MSEYKLIKLTPEDEKKHILVREKIYEIFQQQELSVNVGLSILLTTTIIIALENTSKEDFNEAFEQLNNYLLYVYNEYKEILEND